VLSADTLAVCSVGLAVWGPMLMTTMQRRYQRFPRLMFLVRRIQRVNYECEMDLLDVLCDPGKTSIDVGAKIGMYTFRLLRHSRDVVAFEPIPVLAGMLRRVFANEPVNVSTCALSDAAGRTVMRVPFGSNGEVKLGRSTIEPANPLEHDDVAKVERIDVETKTLDGCGIDGIGFVKIDVEGHELAVLKGATATLERDRPNLLIEANDRHYPQAVTKLRAVLSDLDYRGFFIEKRRLAEIESVHDDGLFARLSVENFIFVHAARPEVARRLVARFPLRAGFWQGRGPL
jgi:FkbM family methyltransferase